MAPITTRRTPKPFAWSYSKLKNYETCPKRHYEVDIVKNWRDEESDSLKWGGLVHTSMAARIKDGTPLPDSWPEQYELWAQRVLKAAEGGEVHVEQKLAITKDFGPTEWFAGDAWFRGVADVIVIVGDVAMAIDWKTGKIVEDSQQLALMAACVFAHYPQVQKIRTEFAWLAEGDASTRQDFARGEMAEMWKNLWPRYEALEHAHKTTSYPSTPSGLCKRYCPVENCSHYGVGSQ